MLWSEGGGIAILELLRWGMRNKKLRTTDLHKSGDFNRAFWVTEDTDVL